MDSKSPSNKELMRKLRLEYAERFTENFYHLILDPDTPLDEQLDMARDYLQDGANANMRINSNDDRLTHIVGQLCRIDLMELLKEANGNLNMPNKFWQRPLRSVLRSIAVTEEQKQNKQDMIRFMLRNGADPFQQDIFRDSDFFWMDTEDYFIILEELFPSSAKWTEEQKETKLQQLLLADYGGFKMPKLHKDQPPSEETIREYKELNAVYDNEDNYIGQRTTYDMMYHVHAMNLQMSRNILAMQLLNKYGGYVSEAGLDLRNHFAHMGMSLPFRMSDMPDTQVIGTELAKLNATKCFGNKDGSGNIKKMLKAAYQYLRTESVINKATDKRTTALRNKEKYEKLGKPINIIEWEAALKGIVEIDDHVVWEICDSATMREVAENNENCLYGYLLLENKHFICVCTKEDKVQFDLNMKDPENKKFVQLCVFDTDLTMIRDGHGNNIVQLSPFSKAIGFHNIEGPGYVQTIVSKIKYAMRRGECGNLEEAYLAYQKGAEQRDIDYDKTILITGSDPTGEDFEENLKGNMEAWNECLGDTIRDITLLDFSKELHGIVIKHQFEERQQAGPRFPA